MNPLSASANSKDWASPSQNLLVQTLLEFSTATLCIIPEQIEEESRTAEENRGSYISLSGDYPFFDIDIIHGDEARAGAMASRRVMSRITRDDAEHEDT